MSNLSSRDPYSDLVLAHLLDKTEAVQLSRAELTVLTAAVRSEVLTNHEIHKVLRRKAQEVVAELASSRRHFSEGG